MRYCKNCILPDSRPNLMLDDDGVCNACRSHESKKRIDWTERKKDFWRVVEHAKPKSKGYDCLIPVSGGKDSTWQVVTCLEYGMNPLAFTWKTPARTPLGQDNLDNLVRLGVDHIDYQVSPSVEKKFLRQSFVRFGTPGLPQHMAIFNMTLNTAVRYDIPLIVWGENSAFEYGGSEERYKGFALDTEWIRKYGVTHGTCWEDWISHELTRKELTPYRGPTDAELNAKGIRAVFLGYYFRWDPILTTQVATQHGFKSRTTGPKTGYYASADIDCDFIAVHHHLKWYKFGFTRAWDNLSIEIRNGRLTRDAAIDILRGLGDETPHEDIDKFCRFIGMSNPEFFDTCENFRNRDLWVKDHGTWKIKDFLIQDWKWT